MAQPLTKSTGREEYGRSVERRPCQSWRSSSMAPNGRSAALLTARLVARPTAARRRRHAKKNIVITEKATGEVIGLGATQPGSQHDKAYDEEGYTFPEGSTLFQDTGFQGYAPEGATVEQPTKKPRGKELSPEQKEENRKISGERVFVEHSIGGIKVFHIVSTIFRNIKEGFNDLVMETQYQQTKPACYPGGTG